MLKFLKKYSRLLMMLLIVFVSVILIISAVTMLSKYKNEITERSSSAAQYNTLIARNVLEDKFTDYTVKAVEIATKMSDVKEEDISGTLDSYTAPSGIKGIIYNRYFNKEGKLTESNGTPYTLTEDVSISYRKDNPEKAGYVGTFDDSVLVDGAMSIMGFYAPVYNSEYVTGVVNYYLRQELVELFKDNYKSEDSEFTVICTDTGKVVSGLNVATQGAQVFTYLRDIGVVKECVDKVERYVQSGEDGTVLAKIGGEEYLISIGSNKQSLRDLAVIEMYKIDVLYASSLDFVQAIISVVIIFAVIVLGVICYLILTSLQMKKKIFNMETNDVELDCLNRHGFEKEAKRILEVNPDSSFVVIVIQLRHYKHLTETCSESEVKNLLKFLKLTLSKTVQIEEIYGHSDAGEFLLLLHAKDRKAVLDRLKVHSFLAKQYRGQSKFDVMLRYGIYEIKSEEKVSVSQMIDFANEANNTVVYATTENAGMKYNFYSDELRQIRIINESMELRMDSALKEGEFQIFYQPKYNFAKRKQDGCEALVRWYDAKTDEYNRPALFMKLFETNGFVVKLDKYVYTKVCEYISYSIAQGRQVYPVSVNISRVTAIQTDFVEFYTSIKRKYNIPDGLLMIEFTETFAYENYETLSGIVDKLHKNGFKCSIDDFGCGYSSYRILKSLPMDEIKLDKFFLEKGSSEKRDNYIFESVITLAKKLGMKVTQEGVETKEDLERIKELGCDVVQGYYYAHPMGLNDYLNFVVHQADHII